MPSPHLADLHDSDGPTLMTYLDWLRRRWWILALAALLGVGAGLLVTQLQTRTYTSTTSLLVRQLGPDANPTAKVNLDTEAQVVRSLVVAERARALIKTDIPAEDLVRTLTVTVPPNSQVLQVTYSAATPESAQAGSHSFAQAYLDLRLATATKALEGETTAIQQQIGEVQKQLATVAGRIAAAPANSAERARAEADRSVLTNQLATLNSRLSPLVTSSLNPGEIISDAPLPRKPSSPNQTLNLASGMGAGLLLGIVLALVIDRLDTRVRRSRDIAGRLGLPVLLELPARTPPRTVLPPAHQVSRELGRLRNVLLSTLPEPQPGRGRQLLLTGASGGPTAGFVAGNLAAAFARTGQQVAVVTTKANSPLAAMLGGVKARHTLADVLRRDVSALTALVPAPGLGQLRVLLPGDLDAEAELPVAGLLEVLAELAGRFDHVLIETAPPTVAVEAQALARHVDAVILVVESGRTRSSEITAALRQFEQVDAPVLGAVLAPRLADSGPGAAAESRPAAP
ncbi:lipopolysaccharide biosynthesis protein, partial [Micromonospora echinofusca]|nr:lipopolysaccharide biosynthesis protein [Micromonospora echinofusca]